LDKFPFQLNRERTPRILVLAFRWLAAPDETSIHPHRVDTIRPWCCRKIGPDARDDKIHLVSADVFPTTGLETHPKCFVRSFGLSFGRKGRRIGPVLTLTLVMQEQVPVNCAGFRKIFLREVSRPLLKRCDADHCVGSGITELRFKKLLQRSSIDNENRRLFFRLRWNLLGRCSQLVERQLPFDVGAEFVPALCLPIFPNQPTIARQTLGSAKRVTPKY
jgi:hypothetical protein